MHIVAWVKNAWKILFACLIWIYRESDVLDQQQAQETRYVTFEIQTRHGKQGE